MSAQRDRLLKQCDCAAAKWPKCPHAWHLKLQHAGTRYSVSLDVYAKRRGLELPRSRGAADDLADRIVKEIETGTYQAKPVAAVPATAPAAVEGLTVDQAAVLFCAAVFDPDMATLDDETKALARIGRVVLPDVGAFGALPMRAVTEAHLEAVHATLGTKRAAATRLKYKLTLVRLFAWAAAKGHIDKTPVTDDTVFRVGKLNVRVRRVKPDEEERVLAAAGEGADEFVARRLVALIVAALELGLRVGELLALQWRDILWAEGRVDVRAQEAGARKNRKPRQVLLTPRAAHQLRLLERRAPLAQGWAPTHYVFGDAIGGRVGRIRVAFYTAVLKAHQVPVTWRKSVFSAACLEALHHIDLHFHDLRRECALRWLAKGYTLPTIAKLLGHSNLEQLRVYLGIAQEDALEEAARLNAAHAGSTPPASRAALNLHYSDRQRRALRLLAKEAKTANA